MTNACDGQDTQNPEGFREGDEAWEHEMDELFARAVANYTGIPLDQVPEDLDERRKLIAAEDRRRYAAPERLGVA